MNIPIVYSEDAALVMSRGHCIQGAAISFCLHHASRIGRFRSNRGALDRKDAALRQGETPRRDRACVRHAVRYEVFDNSHGHGIFAGK
jgi:hypothetical protein